MSEAIFRGLFDTDATPSILVSDFLLCIVFSLVLGLIVTLSYMYKTRYTKSFVVTVAILPTVVCIIIMMVSSGNVGTGIAVAGAFNLVRFRSVPGSAKEIGTLFLAMGTGLIVGMGYLGYGVLFTMIMCGVFMLYNHIDFGAKKNSAMYKTFRVTIPEDLDYTGVFEEIFSEYTHSCELTSVKTTNMGSLFRLTYDVVLKDFTKEKELIDKLRCRNGNLEITVSKQSTEVAEL